jgi:tetratricopeptide (TPR) repeat protein
MAEGFELVRTIRQHLRRGAAFLDEGRFDEALAEIDSALALDAHSLPAQTLRDRIHVARTSAARAGARSGDDRVAAHAFVPHGVNAASWRGFEQRITERRFKAMLETINTSIVAGDGAAARAALEEARELRPDASELSDFEARVAAVPAFVPLREPAPPRRIWMRAMGAAALFLVGVSMLLGIEWMRPGGQPAPVPIAAPEIPAVTPTQDRGPAETPELGPVPVAINDEDDSVPAIETPPEPLLRPRATTGIMQPEVLTRPEIIGRPVAMRDVAPPAVERTFDRRAVEEDTSEEPSVREASVRETRDDYVATPRGPAAGDAGHAITSGPASRTVDTPVTAASVFSSGAVPAAVVPAAEQGRVEEVLQRYARAYGQLDARAARAVWPSVDEKALARAFQNLSSQNVSFADCEIDIRGVVANASCRGQASYAPKVGNRDQRTESRLWRFELRRDGDAWKIENAEARRQSSTEYR